MFIPLFVLVVLVVSLVSFVGSRGALRPNHPQVATLFIVSRVAYIVLYALSNIPLLAVCRSLAWIAGLVLCGGLMRESATVLAAAKQ